MMRKVILDLAVTLDGFIEGSEGETDWCIIDDEMDFPHFLTTIDTIFYGRVSFDVWGNYWPNEDVNDHEAGFWKAVHSKKKYVFSSQERQDNNATFICSGIPDKVRDLKQEPGKDIWLYGGANLIKTFMQHALIDVYRISVHPTVLGKGKPLFQGLQGRVDLSLIDAKTFQSGVVQLIYRPKN